jgi:hypothetical protein
VTPAVPANFDGTAVDAFRDVPLTAHPLNGAGPVHSLRVSGTLQPSASLTLEFDLSAELSALVLAPSVCRRQRRDELWRHTCFELFARRDNAPGYCEFNFSPAGDWAAYQFADYRGDRRNAEQQAIEVSLQTTGVAQIRVRARLDLAAAFANAPAASASEVWRLNCAAVIESTDGSLSYWAVRHPRLQPDFHDAAGFCIALREASAPSGQPVARP